MPTIPVTAFYQLSDYVATTDKIARRHIDWDYLHISEPSRPFCEPVLNYFKETTFTRAGILQGEYVLGNEMILLRRNGICIKANVAWENPWISNSIDEYCSSPWFLETKKELLERWDELSTFHSPLLLYHPYAMNYYHWTFEVVTKSRFFADNGTPRQALISASHLGKLFQRDLFSRTLRNEVICPLSHSAVRVIDPMLSYEEMSEDGILWLRENANIETSPGNRRIYMRRSTSGSRSAGGGGISESPEFIAFLNEYGFETVDFGDQEMTIQEQVSMIDKAAVIIAPHGAAMTNLAYLKTPLALIEINSPMTPRGCFIHITSLLHIQHYAIFCNYCDNYNNMVVNMEELRACMKEAMKVR